MASPVLTDHGEAVPENKKKFGLVARLPAWPGRPVARLAAPPGCPVGRRPVGPGCLPLPSEVSQVRYDKALDM